MREGIEGREGEQLQGVTFRRYCGHLSRRRRRRRIHQSRPLSEANSVLEEKQVPGLATSSNPASSLYE